MKGVDWLKVDPKAGMLLLSPPVVNILTSWWRSKLLFNIIPSVKFSIILNIKPEIENFFDLPGLIKFLEITYIFEIILAFLRFT